MSTDLILYGATRADLVTWGETHPPGRPIVETVDDGEGGTTKQAAFGIEFSAWSGSGQFKTAEGTYDEQGNELTPPTFAPGYVVLTRVHSDYFDFDRLEDPPVDPEDVKEWERSKIAQYIRNNGTPGTMGGIPYYEVDGIRLFRIKDVNAFLDANDLPGHVFL